MGDLESLSPERTGTSSKGQAPKWGWQVSTPGPLSSTTRTIMESCDRFPIRALLSIAQLSPRFLLIKLAATHIISVVSSSQ